MANKTVKLSVTTPHPQASIIASDAMPAFKGTEDTDLLCGGCSAVIGAGISTQTISSRFVAPVQLLIKCAACGAHNRLSSQVGN